MPSIIEALQNADDNLRNNHPQGLLYIRKQVHCATLLLSKGYNIHTQINPLIEKYEDIDNVPNIEDNIEINQED